MNEISGKRAAAALAAIRGKKPLVHNITNYVVMNYTANALLACGASPVMAHAAAEVQEMTALAGALVLNIGTLSPAWIEAMHLAGERANQLGVPVILDPVGAGATRLRTETAKELLTRLKVSLVRGNASEIMALASGEGGTKGVDSIHGVEEAALVAPGLARDLQTPVAITGPQDLITDGKRTFMVGNGHPLMSRVTGMGCTATALTGAFLAVEPDPVDAATWALSYLGLAGERAALSANGPGSFAVALLDALYNLDAPALAAGARVSQVLS